MVWYISEVENYFG